MVTWGRDDTSDTGQEERGVTCSMVRCDREDCKLCSDEEGKLGLREHCKLLLREDCKLCRDED